MYSASYASPQRCADAYEALYRDVLAGMFHPSDDESAHNTVANAWLGPLETPGGGAAGV